MGVWSRFKHFLGFTDLKLRLDVPERIAIAHQRVEGSLQLTARTPQRVLRVEVRLDELWSAGTGQGRRTREFELGAFRSNEGFLVIPGQPRHIDFSFAFELVKSNADELIESGSELEEEIGRISKLTANEQSIYLVVADVDLEGTPFDPMEEVEVELL